MRSQPDPDQVCQECETVISDDGECKCVAMPPAPKPSRNEYAPWLETGEDELAYFKRRHLEMSFKFDECDRDRVLAEAEAEQLCEDWGGADVAATKEAADLRDEIEWLRGVLDAIANASGAWEARATRMQNWARAALKASYRRGLR